MSSAATAVAVLTVDMTEAKTLSWSAENSSSGVGGGTAVGFVGIVDMAAGDSVVEWIRKAITRSGGRGVEGKGWRAKVVANLGTADVELEWRPTEAVAYISA